MDLEQRLRVHDFAVIVGTPDDVLTRRGETVAAVRDNLLVEYGLAVGVLGRARVSLLVAQSVPVGLPSDLAGLNLVVCPDEALAGGHADRVSALNVACFELMESIRQEWARAEGAARAQEIALARGAGARAIQRLHAAVAALRDLLIVLHNDLLGNLGSREEFEDAKRKAADHVARLGAAWEEDARVAAVESEMDALLLATKEAVRSLPSPGEAMPTEGELAVRGLDLARRALGALGGGSSPMPDIEAQVGVEVARRVELLQRLYTEWWRLSERRIAAATTALQDAVTRSSVRLLLLEVRAERAA